jgi:hypothetical protein
MNTDLRSIWERAYYYDMRIIQHIHIVVARDSVVGIATTLRPGRSGDRISVQRDFLHQYRLVLWLILPPIQCVKCFFLGSKAAGVGSWPPTPI